MPHRFWESYVWLNPLEQCYFTVIRDTEFPGVGTVISLTGRHIFKRLRDRDYGKGVAWVVVVTALVSAERRTHFDQEHAYEPGTKTVNMEGFEYDVRDVLKIFIFPNPSIMRAATSVGDVVECVKAALSSQEPAVVALDIPNFDTRRFLSDFIGELENIVESPDLWHRLGGSGTFATAPTDGQSERQRPVTDFPAAVLAFVEGELPGVYAAAKRKDRKALMPLINRMNEFIEPWADRMKGPKGAIFDVFPDCAHVMVDLGREIAIECDPNVPEAERQRLHLEYQRRLAGCRECAARLEQSLPH